jgi:hypothetical protein
MQRDRTGRTHPAKVRIMTAAELAALSDAADRVDAFLRAYPHDGSSNIDGERIYTYNLHTLRWSDLRLLVDSVEA